MDLGIAGRIAVVGGASSGLGRAAAMRLAGEGCDLLIWSRGADALAAAADEIRAATGRRVETAVADAGSAESASDIARRALDAFGRVDILVLNSGGPPSTDATSTDADAYRASFQLLAVTPITLATTLLPGMRERHWGRVIAIMSWGVREPIAGLVLSNTGRTALAAWMKTVSRVVASDGVTLNGVLPGRFATPRLLALDGMTAQRMGTSAEAVRAQARANVPAGRDGDPDELGSLVTFLASERAAYINGTFTAIDGGLLQST